MTTATNRAAAREASLVFHAALIAYGIDTVVQSLEEWDRVTPTPANVQRTGTTWFTKMLELVLELRQPAMTRLAYAYYRYHRALSTGSTLPPLGGGDDGRDSLSELREDFFSQVEELTPDVLQNDRSLVDPDGVEVTGPPSDEDEPIDIDELDVDDDFDELDRLAEIELRQALINVGLIRLEKELREIDDTQPAEEVDELRDEAHAQAGARQAAEAERVVLNGARDKIAAVASKDPKVIGYARVSGTGSPCGWCAMLISRGAVYKSAKTGALSGASAPKRSEGQTFHENCKCFVEPVYSEEQYDEDDRFDLSRQLSDDWGRVTRGFSGKQALRVWRRFIRERNKAA